MACRGCLECLLKLINFLLTLVGLVMIAFGIYLFVEFTKSSEDGGPAFPSGYVIPTMQLGRPMFFTLSVSADFIEKLPKAWFIYTFIAIGVTLFVISCFGCLGTTMRSGCCITCYALLLFLLILAQLACAAFVLFDKRWLETIPADVTGDFEMVYGFLEQHWSIVRWIAIGVVALEVLLFLLAISVRAAHIAEEYDSDDEIIISARQQNHHQPLLGRGGGPPPLLPPPAAAPLDQRPNRSDAWSSRMREKYGLNTSEFTYNPSDPGRNNQQATQQSPGRTWCAIM